MILLALNCIFISCKKESSAQIDPIIDFSPLSDSILYNRTSTTFGLLIANTKEEIDSVYFLSEGNLKKATKIEKNQYLIDLFIEDVGNQKLTALIYKNGMTVSSKTKNYYFKDIGTYHFNGNWYQNCKHCHVAGEIDFYGKIIKSENFNGINNLSGEFDCSFEKHTLMINFSENVWIRTNIIEDGIFTKILGCQNSVRGKIFQNNITSDLKLNYYEYSTSGHGRPADAYLTCYKIN